VFERLLAAATQTQGSGHDVVGVIVVRVSRQGTLEVAQRARVIARVERDGGCVDVVPHTLGGGRLAFSLAFADAEVQPGSFEEFPLFGVALDDRTELLGRKRKIVAL
jgi:hypothetical protein